MSRLIDADKLIETIKQEVDMKQRYSPKGFINVINSTPTAFDVDDVTKKIISLQFHSQLRQTYLYRVSTSESRRRHRRQRWRRTETWC